MISLWVGMICKKLLTLIQKPSPNITMSTLNSTRNFKTKSTSTDFYPYRPLERLSMLIPEKKMTEGSMTVEAALIVPLVVMFLLTLTSAMEMIRLHNNLEYALWNTGSKIALYANGEDGNPVQAMLTGLYIKHEILDCLGEDYIDNSLIKNGADGLNLWESNLMEPDILDITLTYPIQPLFPMIGLLPFRMANRFYVHMWNGYEIPATTEVSEIVYLAESGGVWHKSRDCTYLQLTVQQVSASLVNTKRNKWGSKYVACEKCAKGAVTDILFITEDGHCFHKNFNCPGIKRTVYALEKTDACAKGHGECSRCAANE